MPFSAAVLLFCLRFFFDYLLIFRHLDQVLCVVLRCAVLEKGVKAGAGVQEMGVAL